MTMFRGNLSRRNPLLALCLASSKGLSTFSPSCRKARTARLSSSALTAHLTDEEIVRVTRDWFDRIVVGWNLCPFADRPNREGTLTLDVVRGTDEEEILGVVLADCFMQKEGPGTTLVIAPECHPQSFEDYLAFCTTLEEDALPENGLEMLQIAPFHPLFEFADSTGVDVWTNRSPYPIFHILREDDVSSAVDKLDGDASRVWKRNINLLEDLETTLNGEETLKDVIRNGNVYHSEAVRNALLRHRLKIGKTGEE